MPYAPLGTTFVCDAVFSDGRKLRVYIYERSDQLTKLCVEIETTFYEAKLLPGFVRLELTPEGRAVREAEQAEKLAAETAARKPQNLAELKAEAERQARQAANSRYQQRRAQQELEADSLLANASRKVAEAFANSKGQKV